MMTVKELISDLERANPDATVTVDNTFQEEDPDTGESIYNNSVYADGDVVASWDAPDE